MKEYGLTYGDALLLVESPEKSVLFEQAAASKKASPKGICNWILGDITRVMNETGKNDCRHKAYAGEACLSGGVH